MATKKKTDCRQYRIGDFARYLGVTAEFLKHYQESGLLDVTQRAESGYRYYGFDQSARILQYMRLRNYGISVKEMGPFLEGGLDEAMTDGTAVVLSGHLDEDGNFVATEQPSIDSSISK